MPDDDYLDDDLYSYFADPGREDGEIPPEKLALEQIPRRLWEQTLAPVPRQQRFYVAQRVSDERLRVLAHEVVENLETADREARQARIATRRSFARTAAPLPAPDAAHVATGPTVQVNVRLRRDDHARLKDAATAAGMKPTTLARALVLNGVAKILRERDDR
jgi:hypothetical protein